MKITRVHSHLVQLPAEEPLAGGPPFGGPFHEFVTVQIETDAGIEGIGVTFFGAALTATLKHAVEQLGALTVGEDPLRIEAVGQKLRDAAESSAGPGGIFTLAFTAIDMALWDIKGKALNQSLAVLLGGLRERVPTYASGALMRTFPLEHVVKAAPLLVERGFRQMKMQLALPGDTSPAREVERARLVREAIGPDIDLMCDINQRWSVHQAIDIGRRLEDVHFFWWEDVTAHDDYAGHRPRGGCPGHTGGRRRVRLRHRAVPPHARGALGGHRHDRPAAGGRDRELDEGRRHGAGVQPAGGEPSVPGDPRAPGGRGAQRPHRGVHAVVAAACSRKRRGR